MLYGKEEDPPSFDLHLIQLAKILELFFNVSSVVEKEEEGEEEEGGKEVEGRSVPYYSKSPGSH